MNVRERWDCRRGLELSVSDVLIDVLPNASQVPGVETSNVSLNILPGGRLDGQLGVVTYLTQQVIKAVDAVIAVAQSPDCDGLASRVGGGEERKHVPRRAG
jgi:hypothetical protein